MFKYIKIFFISAIFITIFARYCGAEEVISWKECVEEAAKQHPDLVSAKEKLNQVKASKEITRSNLLPQLGFDASEVTTKRPSFGVSGSSVQLVTTPSGSAGSSRATTYQFEFTAQQLLFDGFKTSYDLSADQRNIVASQYNYDVTSSNVRLRLRSAYVDLMSAEEFLKVTKNIEDRRKQNLELVKLRYEGGREHRGSLMTAEADLAQASYEVTESVRNIYLAQRQLTKELGRTSFIPMSPAEKLEVTETDTIMPNFETISETVPLLRQLIALKEAAKFGVRSAYAQFYPQIYANGSISNSNTSWPPDKNGYSIGTSINWPIFEGGLRFANAAKTKAVLGQAQADERSGRDGVILTLADTWTKLQDAIDNVEVKRKFLVATQERARIAEAEYAIGFLSFDNWIIIEDDFVSAKKNFITARMNAELTQADWVQAKGGTLDYDKE